MNRREPGNLMKDLESDRPETRRRRHRLALLKHPHEKAVSRAFEDFQDLARAIARKTGIALP